MRSSSTGSLKTVHHWLRSSDSFRTRSSPASIQSWATGAGGGLKLGPTLKPLWTYSSRVVQPHVSADRAKQAITAMVRETYAGGVCIERPRGGTAGRLGAEGA